MNKSLATENSTGVPKKKRFTKLAAFVAAIMMILGVSALASPAAVAAGVPLTGTVSAGVVPSTVLVSVESFAPVALPIQFEVDGAVVATHDAQPLATTPLSYTGLQPGQVFEAWYREGPPQAHVRIGLPYAYQAPPSNIRTVVPEMPISSGTAVTIPIPTDAYIYQDTFGTTLTGIVPIPVGGSLTVIAVSTSEEVALSGAGPWPFNYVSSPDPVLAVPPAPPTFVDEAGRGQDGVKLPSAGCWIYTVNGVQYPAGEFVSISGLVTVKAVLAAGCVVRPGTNTSFEWSKGLSGGGDQPLEDNTATKEVPTCHLEGNGTYTAISPTVNAWYEGGHINHEGDIWAGFEFKKQGETIVVAAQGDQAILANGCKLGAVTPDPEPKPDPAPEPDPAPVPDPAPAPAPAPNLAPAPLAHNGGTQQDTVSEQQQLPVAGERDFIVETSAAGQVPAQVVIGRSLIAASVLLVLLTAALWHRRSAAE